MIILTIFPTMDSGLPARIGPGPRQTVGLGSFDWSSLTPVQPLRIVVVERLLQMILYSQVDYSISTISLFIRSAAHCCRDVKDSSFKIKATFGERVIANDNPQKFSREILSDSK